VHQLVAHPTVRSADSLILTLTLIILTQTLPLNLILSLHHTLILSLHHRCTSWKP